MNTLQIALTVDVDADGAALRNQNGAKASWNGLSRMGDIRQSLATLEDRTGRAIPVTWFVRVDDNVRELCGHAGALLEKYKRHWCKEEDRGSELAWHTHLELFSEFDMRRLDDGEYLLSLYKANLGIWESMCSSPRTFRQGQAWHTNASYACIEQLGLKCDSSCVPGTSNYSSVPREWRDAPNSPYFPSAESLMRPGQERAMVEVPMTSWPILAPWDSAPRYRYFNPGFHAFLFRTMVQEWISELNTNRGCTLILVMHPDEYDGPGKPDGLLSRSRVVFEQNLVYLCDTCEAQTLNCEFVTIECVAERWRSMNARFGAVVS